MSAASRAPRKAGSAPVFGLMRATSSAVSVNDRPSSLSPAGSSSQNANLASPPWGVFARAASSTMGGAPIVSRQSPAPGAVPAPGAPGALGAPGAPGGTTPP